MEVKIDKQEVADWAASPQTLADAMARIRADPDCPADATDEQIERWGRLALRAYSAQTCGGAACELQPGHLGDCGPRPRCKASRDCVHYAGHPGDCGPGLRVTP